MGSPHGVAIIGLGVIARAYLDTIGRHPDVRIIAVADLNEARAREVANEFGAEALSVAEAIAHPDVETVLNLTIPAAHAEIALAAIAAGKDVFGEKPLAVTLAEAKEIISAARAQGVRVGSAPDTVLGTGTQTARKAVEDGTIGRAVSASATMVTPGHEAWHPNPDFYYRPGGGPLLDMGPYYLTSLVHLLGPISRVTGAASHTRLTRRIHSGPRVGEDVSVDVDTHVSAIIEHSWGAISTLVMSFDGVRSTASPIEVHGEAGSLRVSDPNLFDGDVLRIGIGHDDWETVSPNAGFIDGSRGLGLLDFIAAEGDGRASGDLALHVLEAMMAILASAADGRRRDVSSTTALPRLVPLTAAQAWKPAHRNECELITTAEGRGSRQGG